MSRLKLGSITSSKVSTEIRNYVAAIVDSNSGPLNPKLLTEKADVQNLYGEFRYKELYEKLLDDNLPVLLTPIITPQSGFNRSSLRLNSQNALFSYCHPRYKKKYNLVTYASIIEASTRITSDNRTLTLRTGSKHPLPYSLMFTDDDEYTEVIHVKSVNYVKDELGYYTIEFTFDGSDHEYGVTATVEYYEHLDNEKYCFLVNNIPNYGFEYVVPKIYSTIPDLVALDLEGKEVPLQGIQYDKDTGKITAVCPMNLTIYFRLVPDEIVVSRILQGKYTQVKHNQNHYPFVNKQLGEDLITQFDAHIFYSDKDNFRVILENPDSIYEDKHEIRYKITNTEKVTAEQVIIGERIYNYLIDFSQVSDDYLSGDNAYYFTVMINQVKYLFYRYNGTYTVPAEYYDVPVDISEYRTKKSLIEFLVQYLSEVVGNDRVYQFSTECKLITEEGFVYASHQTNRSEDFDGWYDSLMDYIDNQEVFTGSYKNLKNYLQSKLLISQEVMYYYEYINGNWVQVRKCEDINDEFIELNEEDSLIIKNPGEPLKGIVSLPETATEGDTYLVGDFIGDSGNTLEDILTDVKNLEGDKILLRLYTESQNLNYLNFDGLKLNSLFNADQDSLCELTENNKLIEFYSKVKGEAGSQIKIQIVKDGLNDYCYYISVSLNNRIEEYYVYTFPTIDTPPEAFDVRSINLHSELIEVKLYDYVLPNGEVYDQTDIEFNADFNNELVRAVELPECELNLNRYMVEVPDYEDYQNTLISLSFSGYYPDLFIVPELMRENRTQQLIDIYSYVRGSEVSAEYNSEIQGVYSQALIKIEWFDLVNKYNGGQGGLPLIDKNNRMLYFYGDLILDKINYPGFLTIIPDIINSEVLRVPAEKIISNPFELRKDNAVLYRGQPYHINRILPNGNLKLSDTTGNIIQVDPSEVAEIELLLDQLRINYMKYNNLYYYYQNLYENSDMKSLFITQYNCSKISRAILRNRHELIATNQQLIDPKISSIIKNTTDYLPYIESTKYAYSSNNHRVDLSIITNMKTLVNKLYKINFKLELS